MSERSEFSDRPGEPFAARAAECSEAGKAGSASLLTFLHEQESESVAGPSPGAEVKPLDCFATLAMTNVCFDKLSMKSPSWDERMEESHWIPACAGMTEI